MEAQSVRAFIEVCLVFFRRVPGMSETLFRTQLLAVQIKDMFLVLVLEFFATPASPSFLLGSIHVFELFKMAARKKVLNFLCRNLTSPGRSPGDSVWSCDPGGGDWVTCWRESLLGKHKVSSLHVMFAPNTLMTGHALKHEQRALSWCITLFSSWDTTQKVLANGIAALSLINQIHVTSVLTRIVY